VRQSGLPQEPSSYFDTVARQNQLAAAKAANTVTLSEDENG
jgi:hypothetical protein